MELVRMAIVGLGCFAAVVFFGLAAGAAYVVIGAIWAARGEGDVRGDAERDSKQ